MKNQRHPGKLAVIAVALAIAVAVAACGPRDDTELNRLIDNGQAQQALNIITDKLADTPADPVLQILALKANLALCAAEDCPSSNAARLQVIRQLAAERPNPVKINDSLTLAPATLLAQTASQLANQPTMPKSALELYKVTPVSSQAAVINGIFQAPLAYLGIANGKKAALAAGMYQALSNTEQLTKAQRYWALLLNGLLIHQPAQVEGAVIALRSQPEGTLLPPAAMGALPYALLTITPDPAHLAQTMPALLEEWKVPLLQPLNRAAIANEINIIRTTPGLRASILHNTKPQLVSTSTVLTTPEALADLYLMRLSLALNPGQAELWRAYLPLASKAIAAGGPITLLGGEGAPTQPPAAVQEAYITTLFQLFQQVAQKKQSLVPLLSQMSTLKLDTATTTRLERLVKEGLDTALAARRVDDIVAFATFKPNVARSGRQGVVPVLLDAIRDDLQQGDFTHAEELATLLETTLEVDVNYDALILKEFETSARNNGIVDALGSNTADLLLQPASSVQLDMGRLWDYITERFAAKPELVDQQLRNLVAGARGLYGTPTAMYRLFNLFPENTFPLADRHEYLLRAINQSLQEDDRLSGAELTDLAWRLSRVHEGLMLEPLIQNALARATSVQDGRDLWSQSPAAVRNLVTTISPQFAALMRGIDAWDSGRTGRAAENFAQLDASYAEQVAPYLGSLRDKLITASGLYVVENPAQTDIPTALVSVQAPALDASGTLTGLSVTLEARMGHHPVANPVALTTSYGTVESTTLDTALDFETMRARLEPTTSPQAFATTFGNITGLGWQEDSLQLAFANHPPVTFRKLLANPATPLLPQGTFAVTRQLSAANPATDVILPVGSLLTVTTSATPKTVMKKGENLGTIYPATITLHHPGMGKPQEVEGYYQHSNHTLNLTFTPPLVKGGVAKAALRCQVLGPALLCGASHTHANRVQFAHRVLAVQTREDAAADATSRAATNADQTAAWQAMPVSQLLPAPLLDTKLIDLAPVITADTSATTVSITVPPSPTEADIPVLTPAPSAGNADILPPPDFMKDETSPTP